MTRWNSVSAITLALLCALIVSTTASATDLTNSNGVDKVPATTPAPPMPFEPSEQLVYEGEFSKMLLRGIQIAEFKFVAGRAADTKDAASLSAEAKAAAQPLLFTGDIESKGWFRKLFGINFNFHIESVVAPDSFSVLRTSKRDAQGKRVRTSEAVFDRAQNRIMWVERDPNDEAREPRVVNTPLEGAAHDIISAIYFLRTQPLSNGKTFNLVVSDSGRIYQIPARAFTESKKVKSVLGKVGVVRVDLELFGKDRPVEGDGKMSLWFTDDARRIPIRARISSSMGTLEIKLKSVQNDTAAR